MTILFSGWGPKKVTVDFGNYEYHYIISLKIFDLVDIYDLCEKLADVKFFKENTTALIRIIFQHEHLTSHLDSSLVISPQGCDSNDFCCHVRVAQVESRISAFLVEVYPLDTLLDLFRGLPRPRNWQLASRHINFHGFPPQIMLQREISGRYERHPAVNNEPQKLAKFSLIFPLSAHFMGKREWDFAMEFWGIPQMPLPDLTAISLWLVFS